MDFIGISKTFSTKNNEQYDAIGDFWTELSQKYGMENLRGLGYNWTEDSIEYVIGLKKGVIDHANCHIHLPEIGWKLVKGKIHDLSLLYDKIYKDGPLKYEIEMIFENGNCEIWYMR